MLLHISFKIHSDGILNEERDGSNSPSLFISVFYFTFYEVRPKVLMVLPISTCTAFVSDGDLLANISIIARLAYLAIVKQDTRDARANGGSDTTKYKPQ